MAEDIERVMRRAYNMLAYAPQTKAELARKLCRKGASPEQAKKAVDALAARGYLDEADYLLRFVETLGNKKLYGPRRIRAAVREKGFAADTVEEYLQTAMERVDFVAACRARIRRRPPADRADADKLIAALFRCGFDACTVREALHSEREQL